MSGTVSVKFSSHFKVNIPRENAEIFEAELTQRGVKFYVDSNKKLLEDFVAYSILNMNSEIIEAILEENNIDVVSDVVVFSNISEERKILNLYIKLISVFIVLMIGLQVFDKFIKP
ncbi:hypothetical protein ABGT15_07445 [Flavobacterium enshiense]|uniref:hypothetical protein n=1 Tax=Flavobacterium enshiense TaxID=1341165 RepID=UPI00345D3340